MEYDCLGGRLDEGGPKSSIRRSRFVSSSNAPLQHRGGALRDEAKRLRGRLSLKGMLLTVTDVSTIREHALIH